MEDKREVHTSLPHDGGTNSGRIGPTAVYHENSQGPDAFQLNRYVRPTSGNKRKHARVRVCIVRYGTSTTHAHSYHTRNRYTVYWSKVSTVRCGSPAIKAKPVFIDVNSS